MRLLARSAIVIDMSEAIIIKSPNSSGIPVGCIVMWSGAVDSIPSGWALCNGSNGTPDLRNRFIVGAGSTYKVGATGGSNTVTLTAAQMPAHTHSLTGASTSEASISITGNNSDPFGSRLESFCMNNSAYSSTVYMGSHSHSISASIGSAGSGSAHENRPPYYALCFIMYIG